MSVTCDADGRYLGVAVYIFVIDIWAADLFLDLLPFGFFCIVWVSNMK